MLAVVEVLSAIEKKQKTKSYLANVLTTIIQLTFFVVKVSSASNFDTFGGLAIVFSGETLLLSLSSSITFVLSMIVDFFTSSYEPHSPLNNLSMTSSDICIFEFSKFLLSFGPITSIIGTFLSGFYSESIHEKEFKIM